MDAQTYKNYQLMQCGLCSHWDINDNDEVECMWYGKPISEVRDCPVRGLDTNVTLRRFAHVLLDIIAKNRRFLFHGDQVINIKK